VGVLGAAKDVEDAETAAAEARERAEAELVRLQAAQAAANAAVAAALAARERHREASLAHARLREAAHAHARVHEEAAARLARLEAAAAASAGDGDGGTAAEVAADADRARSALAEAERAWSLADEARRTADDLRRDVDAQLARAREALAVDAERRRAYDADRRRYDEAQARLARLREEVGAQRERVARSAQEVRDATAAAEAALAAIPTDLEGVERTYEAARAATATADSRLDALTRRHVDLGREIEEVRVTLARREAALELAREELGALPQGVLRMDLGERVARARLREVEDALNAIGPVNHRAAADHAARRERLENLEVEAVQATLAVTDLEATLERIDRETTARLGAAIERLKVGFRSHVRALFGGDALGEVDAEHEGSRPVGLRIRLQPPGKQTQSLGLLSVGERTMGALAFLFALMADEGAGLPIAVLDEVDAPLDEANIRRFGEFLDSLSRRGTQFVLITHQKATFEVADTLWGVTTEGGVSRVFSIRRDERQEALFEAAAAGVAARPA
jgi:chromosome segregation protein